MNVTMFMNVRKGDYISPEMIGAEFPEYYGLDYEKKRFFLMSLQNAISKMIQSRDGVAPTIKIEGDGIRYLQDREAMDYNNKACKNSVSRIYRVHRQMYGIDTGSFDENEKALYSHRLKNMGLITLALRQAQRNISNQ
jgi:hypothetical protein